MALDYRVEVETIFHGRQRNECWFEPSVALVPGGRQGTAPGVIVTVRAAARRSATVVTLATLAALPTTEAVHLAARAAKEMAPSGFRL